jgi:DNA-binding protein
MLTFKGGEDHNSKLENDNGMSDRNIIYIGRKPVMSYVMVALTCLNQKGLDEVILRARGRAISTAVDTAEVTKRYFRNDLETTVRIGTDQIPQEEGGTRNVSTMEIILTKSPADEDEKEEDTAPTGTQKPSDQNALASDASNIGADFEEAPAPHIENETSSEPQSEDEAPEGDVKK